MVESNQISELGPVELVLLFLDLFERFGFRQKRRRSIMCKYIGGYLFENMAGGQITQNPT